MSQTDGFVHQVLGCQNDIRSSGYCILSSPLKAKVE
jgi:hypothetical protein